MNARFFHGIMAVTIIAVLALSIWGASASQMDVPLPQLLPKLAALTALLAAALFYRWRQEEKLTNVLLFVFWGVLLSNLYLVPMYICARQNMPLQDGLLARIDQAMGVYVPDIVRFMECSPALEQILAVCYDLLLPLMTLALIVPPMCGQAQAAKEYLLGLLVAAVISMPLFAVFQAIGPWDYYGYVPRPEQERCMRAFLSVRSAESFVLDFANVEGLIAFPSFHTILALLSAVAFWSNRWLRWPALGLSVLIVASTLTTGWHYATDVAGGLAVTLASVGAAKAFTRLEARLQRDRSAVEQVNQKSTCPRRNQPCVCSSARELPGVALVLNCPRYQ